MATERELNLDREAFLARHWQSQPLFLPGAIDNFTTPLSADALAGLAMEAEVESRIITCHQQRWTVQHGPFTERDFRRDGKWTLLVQAVDHYIDEVAALRRLVDFIPQWRLDDVMASYAVDGASVGPHYDNYDVFLLQGEGRRLWRIGQFCDAESELLPHDELRILRDFDSVSEYLLEPGDMLYVPPGVAHWGVAQGECTTFSIGFRAPRINDMVSRWVDQLLEQLEPDQFYRDARRNPMTRAGEIHPRDLERALAQVQGALDQASGNHWFGEMVTEPRRELPADDDDLAEALARLAEGPRRVDLNAAGKVAWQQEAEGITVFINGEALLFRDTVLDSLLTLCERWSLQGDELGAALASEDSARLLRALLERGCLYVD